MEARELRIGNLVKSKNHPKDSVFIIYKIYENSVVALKSGSLYRFYIDELEPVPLTEELLLKFGFENTHRIDYGELKPCYAIFSLAIMLRHNSFFVDWIGGNTEIKYVHQLQNLYFDLTGEELTIKTIVKMKPTKFHHQKDYDRLSNDEKPILVMAIILIVMLVAGLVSLLYTFK